MNITAQSYIVLTVNVVASICVEFIADIDDLRADEIDRNIKEIIAESAKPRLWKRSPTPKTEEEAMEILKDGAGLFSKYTKIMMRYEDCRLRADRLLRCCSVATKAGVKVINVSAEDAAIVLWGRK